MQKLTKANGKPGLRVKKTAKQMNTQRIWFGVTCSDPYQKAADVKAFGNRAHWYIDVKPDGRTRTESVSIQALEIIGEVTKQQQEQAA